MKTTDQELVVCEGEEVAKDDRTPYPGQHWQHSEVTEKRPQSTNNEIFLKNSASQPRRYFLQF
jgi:hypothetical protein